MKSFKGEEHNPNLVDRDCEMDIHLEDLILENMQHVPVNQRVPRWQSVQKLSLFLSQHIHP